MIKRFDLHARDRNWRRPSSRLKAAL